MIRCLKIKFVCINMLIVTVMLAVIFGMVLQNTRRNMEERGYRTLQIIQEEPFHRGPATRWNRVPFVLIEISPEGEFHLRSNTLFDSNEDMDLLKIAQFVYESEEKQGILKEYNLRFSRRPFPRGERIVFMDVSMENNILKDLIKSCIKIGAVSYLVFLGISILLAQWAIRPVETAWKNQRQFVADASHELKTPLTVIMTNAELMQEDCLEEASRKQFEGSILTMSHQMRGLVEGLLDLARVDNGIVKTSFEELDFSDMVENALLPFEPLFFEKGMELVSSVEQGISLRGSRDHLQQVVDILLDNAVKYGDPEKKAEVCLQRQGNSVSLRVSTSGEAISREDLKRIFRRFYRIDQARSMNHSYGLGLSIAQSIVEEHRGKIWAESKNGINDFKVLLPGLKHRYPVHHKIIVADN